MANLPNIEMRRLDSQGRVAIPIDMRRALKWEEKDLLSIEPLVLKGKTKLVLSNSTKDHVSVKKRIREESP